VKQGYKKRKRNRARNLRKRENKGNNLETGDVTGESQMTRSGNFYRQLPGLLRDVPGDVPQRFGVVLPTFGSLSSNSLS
jgi:hypothetical protein